MTSKKGPGIRCTDCGCRLDPGERCDCERLAAEKRSKQQQAKKRQIIARNRRIMEQAMIEWGYA